MNIAFDSVGLVYSKGRGIGRYVQSQFVELINNDKENNYFLFNDLNGECSLLPYIKEDANYVECNYYAGDDKGILDEFPQIHTEIVKRFVEEKKIDVFYVTSPMTLFDKVFIKNIKTFRNCAFVATVWDLIPYIFSEKYLNPSAHNKKQYKKALEILAGYDRYLAISQSVKDDLINKLGYDPEDIDVIWGAADPIFRLVSSNKDILKKFGIDEKYILCVGGDDDRKNMGPLIEAYSKLPIYLQEEYQLVITCHFSPAGEERYRSIASKHRVSDRVIFTNFVTDEELISLYNQCTLMAFVSKYEGLGLPVLEAFICGAPVLTSNNSSLVQVAGNAAVLVDPFNHNDIRRGLQEALTKVNLRELRIKGFERAKSFSWKQTAELTLTALEKAANSPKRDRLSIPTKKKVQKIAFFTPLPPLKTGIADYSADIINELKQHCVIDVFVEDIKKVKTNLGTGITVYAHTEFPKRAKTYDEILYQLGNSVFHTYMWDYVRNYKGICVIHDVNMYGVLEYVALYMGSPDFKLLEQALLYDYSLKETHKIIDEIKSGNFHKTNNIELNGFITDYAKKIIVHSDYAKERLLTRDISKNIQVIRHYAANTQIDEIDYSRLREKYGFNTKDIIFGCFGIVHHTKRIEQIEEAFVKLSRQYKNIKLVIIGPLYDDWKDRIHEIIEKNDLQNVLKCTDYVDLETMTEYMQIIDIAVNLRHPYNGETSGTLMRLLGLGKCIIVNNIGSFGEIPDNACIKIPNVTDFENANVEVNAIYEAMETLIKYPEQRENVSKNAREYAKKNLDITLIAKQYYDYLCKEPEDCILTKDVMRRISEYAKTMSRDEIHKLSFTLGGIKHSNTDSAV
ncbi:glycosyltransferase [Lachnospiraceae bacterium 54-53]